MAEIKYTVVENILNKLYASNKEEEYEEFKTNLIHKKFIVEYKDIAWMRSHLIWKSGNQEVIEANGDGKPVRWRSHSCLTEEELDCLIQQLKMFY